MNILDRYVLRQFVVTFVFALVALSSIFIIIDLFERLDKFIDNKTPIEMIVRFYLAFLPYILELVNPVALMLAGLFSVGRLSNNNEITAMRSGGQGPIRFLLPILAFAFVMSIAQMYFNGWIAPRAATERFAIERKFLASENGPSSLQDLFFRESPSMNVSLRRYDAQNKVGTGVAVEEFGSAEMPRQQWRIDADSMEWDSTSALWVMPLATKRTFYPDSVAIEILRQFKAPFTIRHDQIAKLQLNPEEMTFPEMKDYIETLKRGGKDTRRQEIDLSGQWAFPFVNLIVVLISIPFASVRRRGGMAVNIAAAMVIAITYIAFTKISQAAGAAVDLPVEVIGWSANAIFLVIGLAVLARTRA
ncbi:MAG: LptF/LptG family permease [Ignavibacteria bacterium]|nr:LptF/LptG family permease [Ignavibacteria bacterium]MBP6510398.1 LptF/LptG family permease [Candidatus Kapabacteria bacterium]MBK6419161.1 LptF/LptG family permease [Ignavibacteria bacterium]MBK6760149.1 LptF/LptG family permease [Ignavibacteria bacterium]MBK7185389.1 LptF/LptG family permease [Ignavibacteria bacterium]